MSAPPRIAFWGNFGTHNLGNECTLRAAIENARARLPGAELSCICSDPADVEQRHGLPSSPLARRRLRAKDSGPRSLRSRLWRRWSEGLQDWREAIARSRRTELLVMAGTGLLTDEGEGSFGLPMDIFRWALAARLGGCRLAFVSVGAEQMRRPLTRIFLCTALRLAQFRSYRDRQSRERVRSAGFSSDRDAVYPDLAFSLAPSSLPHPVARRPAGAKVAVGLYDYRGRGRGGGQGAAEYQGYVDKICSLVLRLRERGQAVRLVLGDNTYDGPVLEDVRAALAARGVEESVTAGIEDRPAASFEELLAQLAEADLVVASRFHGVLLALLLGRPVVSISYDAKNDALMEEMGLGEFCQRIEEFDVERVLEQLSALERRAAVLIPVSAAKASAYRADLQEQYDLLFSTLSRPARSPG